MLHYFFQISLIIFFWCKIYSFSVTFFIKGLIFVILWGSSFIFSWFHLTVPACWKHLLSFLLGFIVAFLFCIQSGESIYDAPWFGFIYDIYKPITEQSQRQTHYLSLIPNYFDIYFLVNHKVILWLHLLHH